MFEKRIVAIHSISDQNLSQNRLIHYIRTMRFLGYKFVSVDTILSDKHNGKLLALTVDDGYKSCIKNLIPVLEKYKIPALMFLPTQLLGLPENHDELLKNECYRNESIMSVEDVNLWVHKGFDIGFHTGKHIDLYYHEDQEIEKDFREGMDIFRKNGWIGANCVITKNVRIGTGAIIGAGSVVTKDIPSMTIATGIPAKVIKKRYIK